MKHAKKKQNTQIYNHVVKQSRYRYRSNEADKKNSN